MPIDTTAARVRALNDDLRRHGRGGRLTMTAGVAALPPSAQQAAVAALQRFEAFDDNNDPYQEHDFGALTVGDTRLFFKIDCYDQLPRALARSGRPGCDLPRPDADVGGRVLSRPSPAEPCALWPIRRVYQAHEHGCGIACVAMLAGVGYWDVCLAIFGDLEGDATSLADLRDALRSYGLRVSQRATPFWERGYEQLRQHALLITDPDRCGGWHAAVWDAGRRRIVDPLRQPNRCPVVVGYLAVDRPMVAGNRQLSWGDDQGEAVSARLRRWSAEPAGR